MEIKDDLISRAYVLAEYDRQHKGPPGGARKIMVEAPAVDAVPVVHARWFYKDRHRKTCRQYTGYDDMGEVHTITVIEESEGKEPYCSECGAQAAESFINFCPNCGAKMDGGENNGD